MTSLAIQCTNGIKEAMLELTPAFERANGATLAVSYGSTKIIVDDLNAGAAADLAILTAEAIDSLIRAGKIKAGSRLDLAKSGIGVAVRKGAPKPDISTSDALKRALLAAKRVSYSRVGASGIYVAGTVIPRLGLEAEMKSRTVIPEAGTFVGTLLARGDADIGFQQISELMPVAGIDIVGPLPPELQTMTVFAGGISTNGKATDLAAALLQFLAAPAARPVLQKHGLEPA